MRLSVLVLSISLVAPFSPAPVQAADCTDCDSDGLAWPTDCNDADPLAFPGAPEACDGRDNDCDGLVDEAATCRPECPFPDRLGPERRLTTGLSYEPSLVWNGSEFGIAWTTGYEIYFARVSRSGQMLGTPVQVSAATRWTRRPSLVWTGSEYGLAWDREFEIHFAVLARDGSIRVPERALTASACDALAPSLAWNGNTYGLAWEDCRSGGDWEIYFAALDRDGSPLLAGPTGAAVRVTQEAGNSLSPRLAWTGSAYAVAWHDLRSVPDNGGNYEIFLTRLDAAGSRLGPDVRLTAAVGSGFAPDPVWTGNEIGVSWIDRRDDDMLVRGKAYFTLVDELGTKLLDDRRVTPDHPAGSPWPVVSQAHLAWTGSEFGLTTVAVDPDQGGAYETYLQRLDLDGAVLSPPVRLSLRDGDSWSPNLAWTGEDYGAVWDDNRRGPREIYFAGVACDCSGDSDGDGASTCSDCDDLRADVFPDAPEICNLVDTDCDGDIDDACLNRPPVAEAGAGLVVECQGPMTAIVLDGRDSIDPDGSSLQYTWIGPFPEGGGAVQGQNAVVSLPVGASEISLLVADGFGGYDTDTVLIEIRDSRPPTLSLAASPAVIWPPDHRLVDAEVHASALDRCGEARVRLVSVVSSEPPLSGAGRQRGPGGDILGAEPGQEDFTFQLRADRDPGAGGRMYTALYEAIDGAGNTTSGSVTFLVPHDLRLVGRSRPETGDDGRIERPLPPPRDRRERTRQDRRR